MLRTRLLPCLLAAVAALAVAPAANAAEPGVNLAGVPTTAEIDVAAATGAKTARIFVLWKDIEPAQGGALHTESYARIASDLAARGMKAVFVVIRTPAWANGGAGENAPPTNPADMASFLQRFAATPGIQGNVAGYEIWNEQDEDHFWHQTSGSRPATYAALVNAVGHAIQRRRPAGQVDPRPDDRQQLQLPQQLYEAGIDKSAYDAIAVHTDTACLDRGPYSFYRDAGRIARFTFLGYREVRATALANGDDKPIWMTELGWTTTGEAKCERGMWAGQKPAGVNQADQAKFLQQAFNCMAEDPYVTVAQWFTLRDNPAGPIEELRHYGLTRAPAQAKPSLAAFRAITANPAYDVLNEACGDFDGPQVTIHAPTTGQRFSGALLIKASATGGVARLTFKANGVKIRNFTGAAAQDGKAAELLWQGAKRLPAGAHKITVEAVDAAGNSSESTVDVIKGAVASTIKSTVKLAKKVKCKGRTCTITGRATAAGTSQLDGKVQILWQLKSGKRWKTLHKATKQANKSFSVRQKVRKAGRWRVQVRYLGAAPYKPSPRTYKSFRVR